MTLDQIKEFSEKYPTIDTAELAGLYKVKESYLRILAIILKVKKTGTNSGWKQKDIVYLLKNYETDMSINDIAAKLGRSRWAIINKYRELKNLRMKAPE